MPSRKMSKEEFVARVTAEQDERRERKHRARYAVQEYLARQITRHQRSKMKKG